MGRRLLGLAAVVAMVLAVMPSSAADTGGVDPLRGRWDVTAEVPGFGSTELRLLVRDVDADPDDPAVSLATGCLVMEESGVSTPMSMRAEEVAPGVLDVTWLATLVFSTGDVSVARFDGVIDLYGRGVSDDATREGTHQSGFGDGEWSAVHHDRRLPKCAAVDDPGLTFQGDVYTAQDAFSNAGSIFEGFTNIVATGMRVTSPTFGTVEAMPFTDLFTPGVDFVTEFRFLGFADGAPAVGEEVTFVLLDLLGNEIPGTESSDTWNGCLQGAPQNLQGTFVSGSHIDLSWNPVTPAPGFDPAAGGPGFYQIESDSGYGASGIQLFTHHHIPWSLFAPGDPGFPDGNDFGTSLSEIDDGVYGLSVIAFAEEVGPGGVGLACQVRDEPLYFEKTGTTVTIPVPPPGP